MKKYLMDLIVLLFINIFMSVYLSGISIFNVLPAVNLIFLTCYSANMKEIHDAAIFGFTLGFIVDILFGTTYGFNTLVYMYLAVIVNYVTKRFLSNEPIIVLLMLIGTIFLYDFITFVFFFMFEGKTYFMTYLFKIIVPEIIYTTVLYFPLQALVLKYKRVTKNI